jgi:hypothetical protein
MVKGAAFLKLLLHPFLKLLDSERQFFDFLVHKSVSGLRGVCLSG